MVQENNQTSSDEATRLGSAFTGCPAPLLAWDEDGNRYFKQNNGQLLARRSAMPAMLTRDTRVTRQDCSCHLMERMSRAETSA